MSNHTVYAVASGKGGVGKTTTAVNLGVSLARRGNTVVVVDVDLGMANLSRFIGFEPEGPTLHDVLAGDAEVQEAAYQVADRLAAVPCGEDLMGFANADPKGMTDVVETLREAFEVVLLDVGGGLSHDTVLPLGVADWVLLVTEPSTPALVDTARTLEVADLVEGSVGGAVVTRARPGQSVTPEDVEEALDTFVLVSVPEDPAVRESIEAGMPLLAHAPDSPAAEAYEHLADVLAGDAKPRPELPETVDEAGGGTAAAGDVTGNAAANVDEPGGDDAGSVGAESSDDSITIPGAEAGGDVSPSGDRGTAEDVPGQSEGDDADDGLLDDLLG